MKTMLFVLLSLFVLSAVAALLLKAPKAALGIAFLGLLVVVMWIMFASQDDDSQNIVEVRTTDTLGYGRPTATTLTVKKKPKPSAVPQPLPSLLALSAAKQANTIAHTPAQHDLEPPSPVSPRAPLIGNVHPPAGDLGGIPATLLHHPTVYEGPSAQAAAAAQTFHDVQEAVVEKTPDTSADPAFAAWHKYPVPSRAALSQYMGDIERQSRRMDVPEEFDNVDHLLNGTARSQTGHAKIMQTQPNVHLLHKSEESKALDAMVDQAQPEQFPFLYQ